MKKPGHIIAYLSAMLALFAAPGCEREKGGAEPEKKHERTWVRMTGTLPVRGSQGPSSRAELVSGPIDPVNGLPPKQLDVAIITVNHIPSGLPGVDLPGYTQWAGHEAETTRGFFGSNDGYGILDAGETPTNGQIEYVNEVGEYIQRVFYPETLNEYYYVKVVYPWQGFDQFIQMPDGTGAAVVFSGLTGQEDLLCSNIGWGTQTQPIIETDDVIDNPEYDESETSDPEYDVPKTISVLNFSHILSQLRFWVLAENDRAQQQYGDITDIVVRFQPDKLVLRMIDDAVIRAENAVYKDFSTNYFDGDTKRIAADDIAVYAANYDPVDHGGVPQGTYAGSLMVLPDYTYRIEANTTKRKWIGADYDFRVNDLTQPILPGRIYDISLKFMEAYMLEIKPNSVGDWWMDSVFD